MSLSYSSIPQGSVPPPKPALNGGLYGGAPFAGPWGNVPVTPDVDYMISQNLKSANPPPHATTQYPGNVRPGNNAQQMPGVAIYDPTSGYVEAQTPDATIKGVTCSYGKYALWEGAV